jgi:uncharacterized membrane protein
MVYLLAGLFIFLGVHSVRVFADGWRNRLHDKLGMQTYQGLYSVLSLAGFVLIVWGFGMARQTPVQLWVPPVGMRHLAALLTLLAFVLLASAYVPGNMIKARVHHPMVAGVKVWAFAHLLANGNLAHVILFGSFLAWAVLLFIASRKRDRRNGSVYPAGQAGATGMAIAIGVASWIAFTLWLHGWLIGVRPFG